MMAGYVLLGGEAAFQEIVDQKLLDPASPSSEVYAAINAVRFVHEYLPQRISPALPRNAARSLLDRREYAEVVLPDLARWNDWDITPTLLARFGQPPFDTPFSQKKLIAFAQSCLKAAQNSNKPDTPRADLPTEPAIAAATEFLELIKRDHPQLLKSNLGLLIGP